MTIKEMRVPNFAFIYRLFEVSEDGTQVQLKKFRVRKRIKVEGKWTSVAKTFDDFNAAKVFARSTPETKIAHNTSKTLFEDVFARYMNHLEHRKKLCSSSIQMYRNRIRHFKFFEGMEMTTVTPKVIDGWLNLMLDPDYLGLQQKTRINYEKEFILLSGLFRYYRNHENESFTSPFLDRHREKALARSKEENREIRYMSADEEMLFLTTLESNPVIHDVALFQLHTGTRVGEAAALEFKNIDFSKREVRIVQHLDWQRVKGGKILVSRGTKTGPYRTIPLSDDCIEMLKRRKQDATSGIVFPWSRDSNWLPYRAIQAMYDSAFRKAGIEKSGTHVLRHTFAVRFLDQTKDIYALQRVLGHADLQVTQVYAKYSNESVRQAFTLFRGGKDAEIHPLVSRLGSRK